jgi:hypothetical protein
MKRKSKTFGAVRKPSGRVVIEGLTPWHVSHLQNSLNELTVRLISTEYSKGRKHSVMDQIIGWLANGMIKKFWDLDRKSISLKPMEVGVFVLALSIYDDIPWVNLKSQLHRYML